MSPILTSDIEDSLAQAVSRAVSERWPLSAVAQLADAPDTDVSSADTTALRDLGLAGLLIPEQFSGAEAGAAMAGVAADSLGVVPGNFLSSAVLATTVLTAVVDGGRNQPAAQVLESLAGGESIACLLVPAAAATAAEALAGMNTPATASGAETSTPADTSGAGTSTTHVTTVIGATGATTYLAYLPTGGDGGTLVLADEVSVEPVVSFDASRPVADVAITGTGTVLATGSAAAQAVDDALLVMRAVLAAEQAGIATRAFDTALEYIKGRRQFGRLIGSYQAIKHRMADTWLAVQQAQACARYALTTLDAAGVASAEARIAVETAASFAAEVAVAACEESLQMHGGNGMTWEYPIHVLLKRAKADEVLCGSPAAARARLAELLDIPVS